MIKKCRKLKCVFAKGEYMEDLDEYITMQTKRLDVIRQLKSKFIS